MSWWEAVSRTDVLCFNVPAGKKFTKESLHPIIKNYTSDGRPTYIAEIIDHTEQNCTGIYDVDVMEGMTLTDVLVRHKLKVADVAKLEFHVVVLRYLPETYPLRPGLVVKI